MSREKLGNTVTRAKCRSQRVARYTGTKGNRMRPRRRSRRRGSNDTTEGKGREGTEREEMKFEQ